MEPLAAVFLQKASQAIVKIKNEEEEIDFMMLGGDRFVCVCVLVCACA
jgi:hypothetical protein